MYPAVSQASRPTPSSPAAYELNEGDCYSLAGRRSISTFRSTRCNRNSTRRFPRRGSSSTGLPDKLLSTRDPSSVEEVVADIAFAAGDLEAQSFVVDNLAVESMVVHSPVVVLVAVVRSYRDLVVMHSREAAVDDNLAAGGREPGDEIVDSGDLEGARPGPGHNNRYWP
ncbi:hypothetical protein BJX70DRAFT_365526 [Aspergillus crustosus]